MNEHEQHTPQIDVDAFNAWFKNQWPDFYLRRDRLTQSTVQVFLMNMLDMDQEDFEILPEYYLTKAWTTIMQDWQQQIDNATSEFNEDTNDTTSTQEDGTQVEGSGV